MPRLNYHNVNLDEFNEVLANKLDVINPPAKITNPEHFETTLAALTQAIAITVKEKVPQLKLSPYAKCWWTKKLGLK
jgi:hypothetical protein